MVLIVLLRRAVLWELRGELWDRSGSYLKWASSVWASAGTLVLHLTQAARLSSSNALGDFLMERSGSPSKGRILVPYPRPLESDSLGMGLGICVFNKAQSEAYSR